VIGDGSLGGRVGFARCNSATAELRAQLDAACADGQMTLATLEQRLTELPDKVGELRKDALAKVGGSFSQPPSCTGRQAVLMLLAIARPTKFCAGSEDPLFCRRSPTNGRCGSRSVERRPLSSASGGALANCACHPECSCRY
jgi:hypothetical protein